jgi:general secretion pathway protein F
MHFELKAIRDGGSVLAIDIEAFDEAEAIRQAKSQGLSILTIKPKQSWRGFKFKSRSRFAITLFSQELLALLNAGLSLVEAFETLAEKEQHAEVQKVLRQLINTLYEGRTLSSALQQFPEYFPVLYVATVRASETTGDLSVALSRYVAYQEQMDLVRKKIVSASIYPALLLFAGGLVILFLIGYVVPKFSLVYEQMGRDLPLFSRLLMNLGQTLRNNGVIVAAAGIGFIAGTVYLLTRPANKQRVLQKLWQIPALGNRMKIYQLARFYRTLGMLLQGGTPIVTALKMTADLLPGALRGQLTQAANAIREGASISQAMERHNLTTAVASRMLVVGERSGLMGEMMDRIAAFHDEEMARWVEWFSKLFEPILMAVIGLVIGIIVVLMYFPIFELAGSIQ